MSLEELIEHINKILYSTLTYGIPTDVGLFTIKYEIEGLKWTIKFIRKNLEFLKIKKAKEKDIEYLKMELKYKEKRLAQRKKDLITNNEYMCKLLNKNNSERGAA